MKYVCDDFNEINSKVLIDNNLLLQFEKINDILKLLGKNINQVNPKDVNFINSSRKKIINKLKEKLGVDFRKYLILGACNPSYAYEALQKEDKIGTMLPCNIIIQEHSQNKVEVAVIDPVASMQAVNNPSLADLGNKIRNKLQKVIEAL